MAENQKQGANNKSRKKRHSIFGFFSCEQQLSSFKEREILALEVTSAAPLTTGPGGWAVSPERLGLPLWFQGSWMTPPSVPGRRGPHRAACGVRAERPSGSGSRAANQRILVQPQMLMDSATRSCTSSGPDALCSSRVLLLAWECLSYPVLSCFRST